MRQGIAQAGHNFIIGNADDLLGMIPAAVLGHMGKHGPMLLVSRDQVPQATADYLTMVKPDVTTPNETILNFAWVIGDMDQVSLNVQQNLTRLLASVPRGATPRATTAAAAPEAAPPAAQPLSLQSVPEVNDARN